MLLLKSTTERKAEMNCLYGHQKHMTRTINIMERGKIPNDLKFLDTFNSGKKVSEYLCGVFSRMLDM